MDATPSRHGLGCDLHDERQPLWGVPIRRRLSTLAVGVIKARAVRERQQGATGERTASSTP
jgi:hypothetical protein